MEIVLGILLIWTIVTLVGHATWVVLKLIFRALTLTGPDQDANKPSGRDDVAICNDVVTRLFEQNLIDRPKMLELRKQLRFLKYGRPVDTPTTAPANHTSHPVPTVETLPETLPAPNAGPNSGETPILATLCEEPQPQMDEEAWQPVAMQTEPSAIAPVAPAQAPSDEPSLAASYAQPPSVGSAPSSPPPAPAGPVLSRSEIIQSFLAAHNIRWGELVAGLLIVVCSIGLVISLWAPLVSQHRVIPSFVFLSANAAIFAAALYTLSRWRLRHTSRAVLVIATLLVPLSVLAGLAAAGTGADAVPLDDLVAVGGIATAGLIYGVLLWLGGRALTGTSARQVTLAVAGPVVALPFIPALVRAVGPQAGWAASFGATAILIANLWNLRSRRSRGSLGPVSSRNQLLMMAFSGFALAVLAGYTVFMLRGYDIGANLPVAISVVPALVALAGTGRWLMTRSRQPTHSMVGAITCVILVGLGYTILPASLLQPNWLWAWAGAMSVSGVIVGTILKQPRWLPASTLPVGIALVLWSPAWQSEVAWQSIPFWSRVIGGQPMLAATFVAAVVAGITAAMRDADQKRWMSYASMFWVTVSVAIAGILAVGNVAWYGAAPWWSVTAVLTFSAVASILFASRHHAWSWLSIVSTSLAWCSIYRPIMPPVGDLRPPDVWMTTTISIAATMMLLREITPRIKAIGSRPTLQSSIRFESAAVAAAILTTLIAGFTVTVDWKDSTTMLGLSAAILFWAATTSRSVLFVRLSQLTSAAAASAWLYGNHHETLFTAQAWLSGQAFWRWSIVASILAAAWFVVREIAKTSWRPIRHRIRLFDSKRAAPFELVDGPFVLVATALVACAAIGHYGGLLFDTLLWETVDPDSGWTMPIAAILATSGAILWLRRHARNTTSRNLEITDHLAALVLSFAVIWGSVVAASLTEWSVTAQLVLASSVAIAVCLALRVASVRFSFSVGSGRANESFSFVVAGVVTLASAVLLKQGWLEPILDGRLADALPTLSVSIWWMITAGGLYMAGRLQQNRWFAAGSAFLFPAAVALIVPVYSDGNPISWIQYAALASMAWTIAATFVSEKNAVWLAPVTKASVGWSGVVGLTSAAIAIVHILFDAGTVDVVLGPASFAVAAAAIGWWCVGWLPVAELRRPSWPMAITLFSGQAAWLAGQWPVLSGGELPSLLLTITLAAAAVSLVRYGRVVLRGSQEREDWLSVFSDFWHSALVGAAAIGFSFAEGLRSDWMSWIGIAAALLVGGLVAMTGLATRATRSQRVVGRIGGWLVVVFGGWIVVERFSASGSGIADATVFLLWAASWVIFWRVTCSDTRANVGNVSLALPDVEWSWLIGLAACGELAFAALEPSAFELGGRLGWIRVATYTAVAVSVVTRARRRIVWTHAFSLLLVVAGICSLKFAEAYETTSAQRVMIAGVTAAFFLALIVHLLRPITQGCNMLIRGWSSDATASPTKLLQSSIRVTYLFALVCISISTWMIALQVDPSVNQLMVLSVGLSTLAMIELAEVSRTESVRRAAIATGLIAVGLLASVHTDATHAWLEASMRWLVASVITIPTFMLILPKLLGKEISFRWQDAFRFGATIASTTAAGSLITMLAIEAMIRTPDGIAQVSPTIVVGVAITLAILSLVAGLIAILSGPSTNGEGSRLAVLSHVSPNQRRVLICIAQVVAGITWLHVFLCKTEWAFVGLRGYWPYLVMGIAFVSVGATEWAKRRGDQVLADTLRHTALYLPLVPAIGFWLSGSMQQFSWVFDGGRVRYDVLLALGAAYYVLLAAMWKHAVSRIAAVVLGNAALWVVLVQRPDWGFLIHPQAWLIPPAVCVLVTAHFYRDRLQPATLAAVRYGSTLMIYISSTADMLLQEIGTTLSGPIILVSLALLGMLAGVILRVRPFLYLGAAFVFVGVTSMVWHAQRSFDAVWPWWVFGITTGILLLAALMALEKNKDRLRAYAHTLATWQG